MQRNKMLFALAGFAIAAVLASPAQAADPKHEGTCPAGWSLTTVDKAKDAREARTVDGNGDQYVCEKATAGKLNYKDNDKTTGQDKDKDDKPKDKDKPKQ